MKFYEEFKLYEHLFESDTFPFNRDGDYIGPMEKCAKCGADTPKLLGGHAIKTPFGIYCTKCYAELSKPNFRDDFLAYDFSVMYNSSDWLSTSVEFHGNNFIVDTINAWNKAKKDARFVLTADEMAKIEQKFITTAKKCGFEISPRVFTLGTVTINDIKQINQGETSIESNMTESVNTIYSGNLRAYAYYGDTPRTNHNFDNVNPDAPYTDSDNQMGSLVDDYIFSGTLEAWIKKLNKIAKHHQIAALEIADESEHSVFYAANTDPDTLEEYDNIVVFKNEIFRGDEPFMKQFVIRSNNTSNITEWIDTPNGKSIAMNWDNLLINADKRLAELCIKSGNDAWDDGDGYWQTDYTDWCNRKLYYARLNNVAELEKLCEEYSKKLPNVEFYFYDDEDEETSEIGYVASKK